MFRLNGIVKDYPWGGDKSGLVGSLARAGGHVAPEEDGAKYAELWLGTHPAGSALIDGKPISDHTDLPYLLKVLSIRKALSIQVHPNKRLAEELHTLKPDLYDDNQKAEIAIPLTVFEALGGLRSQTDILLTLQRIPELKGVTDFREFLETVDEDVVRAVVDRLMVTRESTFEEDLILRLHSQYPYDKGVLCPVYMEYHRLEPGEALYIPPGCPHAYLSGELVECMTTSDNVMRVALTNKYIDRDALFQALDERARCILYKKDYPYFYDVAGEFFVTIVQHPEGTMFFRKDTLLLNLENGSSWIALEDCFMDLDGMKNLVVVFHTQND